MTNCRSREEKSAPGERRNKTPHSISGVQNFSSTRQKP
jgi:hypothetical protein